MIYDYTGKIKFGKVINKPTEIMYYELNLNDYVSGQYQIYMNMGGSDKSIPLTIVK